MTMPDKHAFLSPSSAERWYNCPPSARLCEQFPDLGSVFAAEGTEAHSLCEYLLGTALGRPGLTDPRQGLRYYTEEMEECCRGYAAFVLDTVEKLKQKEEKSPCVYVEQGVDLRKFIPESMGTSDCIVIGQNEIVVIDFKYGMHRVPATSLQLRLYALGACELFSSLYDFTAVRMAVYQPRIGNVDECSMPVQDLYAWAAGELKERAGCAFRGEGEYAAGEWCRNCRARRRCRHLAEEQLSLARFEFKDPPLLSDGEISEVLKQLDTLETWAKGVREFALSQALSGHRIAGWKVVEGRSVRKFSDNASAAARVEAAGKDPYERKPLSLAALEKMLGRKDFRNLLGDLVVRQEGKPLLVPEDDKRPEFVPADVEFSMTEDDCESVEE
jgi:hypothetical protein